MQSARRTKQSIAVLVALAVAALAGNAVPATAQTYNVVFDFFSLPNGPSYFQYAGTIPQGRDGNLYGTSHEGGTGINGTFFSVSPSGAETTLYNFEPTKGDYPNHGLTLASDGNFYATTPLGGTANLGTIYKMTSAGAITILYNFPNNANGSSNGAPPVQGTDGNFYGVTAGDLGSTTPHVYKVTPAGVFQTIHTMTFADGYNGAALIQGTDGSFYGLSANGGANSCGTIFKVSTTGAYKVLHNFTNTDGCAGFAPLVQGTDGNFYGMTPTNATGEGVIFKMTSSGAFTVLHTLTRGTDGGSAQAGLMQATDGNLYGTTEGGGTLGYGTLFKVTPSGVFTVVHTFAGGTSGGDPGSNLTQHTNGLLYGDTYESEGGGYGVFYTLDIGAAPFIRLSAIAGKAGSQVGIFGQDFSTSSVVKFNGVAATAAVLTGTTYITATVPAGASTGLVTVTTGSTTLTSTQTYLVHNSWSSGAGMPVALEFPATGLASGKIYVAGGMTNSAPVANNQVYNPATNTWNAGASLPVPTYGGASAVVGNVFYVFGGYLSGVTPTNAVWAYKPSTNTWTAKATMPTARGSAVAVVKGTVIYVIGGNGSTNRLNTVESYNTATNAWTTKAPLLVGKSEPSAGLVGTTIVVADGYTAGGDTGDNEDYNTSSNTWQALAVDPILRNAACSGSVAGQLYVAGGWTNGPPPLNATSSFSVTTHKWTPQATLPHAVSVPGSAVSGALLYCFGGTDGTNVQNFVQIYQP